MAAWRDHEHPGTNDNSKDWEMPWNWSEWKDEDDWSGDWYEKRWRKPASSSKDPRPQPLQSLALNDEPSWHEDEHPVTTLTMLQTMTESEETAKQEPGNSTSTSIRLKRPGNRKAYGSRLWVHIFLNQRHVEFDLVKKIIGRGGKNTRDIAEVTGAKVRVRGRGSGHKEIEGKKEAPVPLMVAVTSEAIDASQFARAVKMMIQKLDEVNGLFRQFCIDQNLDPALASEDLWKYGEMTKDAELVLHDEGLLGLVVPLSTAHSSERHAFPPPIPSGCKVRPATALATVMSKSEGKKRTPPKDMFTYARPALPAPPGLINQSEKEKLHQSKFDQDSVLDFQRTRTTNDCSKAVFSSDSYYSQDFLLTQNSWRQAQCQQQEFTSSSEGQASMGPGSSMQRDIAEGGEWVKDQQKELQNQGQSDSSRQAFNDDFSDGEDVIIIGLIESEVSAFLKERDLGDAEHFHC
jgi:hypothetical protein